MVFFKQFNVNRIWNNDDLTPSQKIFQIIGLYEKSKGDHRSYSYAEGIKDYCSQHPGSSIEQLYPFIKAQAQEVYDYKLATSDKAPDKTSLYPLLKKCELIMHNELVKDGKLDGNGDDQNNQEIENVM